MYLKQSEKNRKKKKKYAFPGLRNVLFLKNLKRIVDVYYLLLRSIYVKLQ